MCKPKRKFGIWDDVILLGDTDESKLSVLFHDLDPEIFHAIVRAYEKFCDFYWQEPDLGLRYDYVQLARELLDENISSIGYHRCTDKYIVQFSFFPFNCKVLFDEID